MRFEEKVVFVTGGMKGLGREIVKAFLREGAYVAANGRDERAKRAFEEEFGGEISDEDAQKITTVAEAVNYLEKHGAR